MQVQIGSIIKSYDFPHTFNCYMIGKVTKIEGDYISCDTIKQVFDDKEEELCEFNKVFRTVAQGLGRYDAEFARVLVIA